MTDKRALLLDEMLSGEIATQLRSRGFDVLAVVEDPALVGMTDEDLLAHATTQGRSLVTANISDFTVIATEWRARGRPHAGLMYGTHRTFPQDSSFIGAIVGALTAALKQRQAPNGGTEVYLRRAD